MGFILKKRFWYRVAVFLATYVVLCLCMVILLSHAVSRSDRHDPILRTLHDLYLGFVLLNYGFVGMVFDSWKEYFRGHHIVSDISKIAISIALFFGSIGMLIIGFKVVTRKKMYMCLIGASLLLLGSNLTGCSYSLSPLSLAP